MLNYIIPSCPPQWLVYGQFCLFHSCRGGKSDPRKEQHPVIGLFLEHARAIAEVCECIFCHRVSAATSSSSRTVTLCKHNIPRGLVQVNINQVFLHLGTYLATDKEMDCIISFTYYFTFNLTLIYVVKPALKS